MAGALLAAFPLSHATASFGWRPIIAVAAVVMLLAAIGVACFVRPRVIPADEHASLAAQDATLASPRRKGLWTLMPACLALSIGGTFRTSWGGPYLSEVFNFDVIARGNAMTVTSIAGIGASFCIPVMVRFWAPKRITLSWLICGTLAALTLAFVPGGNWVASVALICVLFSVGSVHPLVMSQARSVIAPGRLGLGLGLLNSLVFLGVAIASSSFGLLQGAAKDAHLTTPACYSRLFVATALPLAVGALVYLLSPTEPTKKQR
jgi:predicted MFS family arabinose efflux permease